MRITKDDLYYWSTEIKLSDYTVYIPIRYCSRKHSQVTIIGKNTNFTILMKKDCSKVIDGVNTLDDARVMDWLILNKKAINKAWNKNLTSGELLRILRNS
jgi:hypothetical protein